MDIFVSFKAASTPETNRLVRTLKTTMSEGRRCKLALRVDFDIHDPLLNCDFDNLLKKRIESVKCILAIISRSFDDHCHAWIDSLRMGLVDWSPTSRIIGCVGAFTLPELNKSTWSLGFKGHVIRQQLLRDRSSSIGWHSRPSVRSISLPEQSNPSTGGFHSLPEKRLIGLESIPPEKSVTTNPIEQHFNNASRRFKNILHPFLRTRTHSIPGTLPGATPNSAAHIGQFQLDEVAWQDWNCILQGREDQISNAALAASKKLKTRKRGERSSAQRSPSPMTFGKPSARSRNISDKSRRPRTLGVNSELVAKDGLRIDGPTNADYQLSIPAQGSTEKSDADADLTWTNQVSLRGFDSILDELLDDLEADEDEPAQVEAASRIKK